MENMRNTTNAGSGSSTQANAGSARGGPYYNNPNANFTSTNSRSGKNHQKKFNDRTNKTNNNQRNNTGGQKASNANAMHFINESPAKLPVVVDMHTNSCDFSSAAANSLEPTGQLSNNTNTNVDKAGVQPPLTSAINTASVGTCTSMTTSNSNGFNNKNNRNAYSFNKFGNNSNNNGNGNNNNNSNTNNKGRYKGTTNKQWRSSGNSNNANYNQHGGNNYQQTHNNENAYTSLTHMQPRSPKVNVSEFITERLNKSLNKDYSTSPTGSGYAPPAMPKMPTSISLDNFEIMLQTENAPPYRLTQQQQRSSPKLSSSQSFMNRVSTIVEQEASADDHGKTLERRNTVENDDDDCTTSLYSTPMNHMAGADVSTVASSAAGGDHCGQQTHSSLLDMSLTQMWSSNNSSNSSSSSELVSAASEPAGTALPTPLETKLMLNENSSSSSSSDSSSSEDHNDETSESQMLVTASEGELSFGGASAHDNENNGADPNIENTLTCVPHDNSWSADDDIDQPLAIVEEASSSLSLAEATAPAVAATVNARIVAPLVKQETVRLDESNLSISVEPLELATTTTTATALSSNAETAPVTMMAARDDKTVWPLINAAAIVDYRDDECDIQANSAQKTANETSIRNHQTTEPAEMQQSLSDTLSLATTSGESSAASSSSSSCTNTIESETSPAAHVELSAAGTAVNNNYNSDNNAEVNADVLDEQRELEDTQAAAEHVIESLDDMLAGEEAERASAPTDSGDKVVTASPTMLDSLHRTNADELLTTSELAANANSDDASSSSSSSSNSAEPTLVSAQGSEQPESISTSAVVTAAEASSSITAASDLSSSIIDCIESEQVTPRFNEASLKYFRIDEEEINNLVNKIVLDVIAQALHTVPVLSNAELLVMDGESTTDQCRPCDHSDVNGAAEAATTRPSTHVQEPAPVVHHDTLNEENEEVAAAVDQRTTRREYDAAASVVDGTPQKTMTPSPFEMVSIDASPLRTDATSEASNEQPMPAVADNLVETLDGGESMMLTTAGIDLIQESINEVDLASKLTSTVMNEKTNEHSDVSAKQHEPSDAASATDSLDASHATLTSTATLSSTSKAAKGSKKSSNASGEQKDPVVDCFSCTIV